MKRDINADVQAIQVLLNKAGTTRRGEKVGVSAVKDNPRFASIASKLITTPESRARNRLGENVTAQEASELNRIGLQVESSIEAAESILEIFPDLALAAETVVSGITSPKDLAEPVLIFAVNETIISPIITQKLLATAEAYLKREYELLTLIDTVVETAMIREGAHVSVVIPESTVDDIINGATKPIAMENLKPLINKNGKAAGKRILGDVFTTGETRLGLESFAKRLPKKGGGKPIPTAAGSLTQDEYDTIAPLFPEVTDNFDLLKLPRIIDFNNKLKMNDVLGIKQHSQEHRNLFKQKQFKTQTMVVLKSATDSSRLSVNKPLYLTFSSRAAIPVSEPGDFSKIKGAFILLDSEGHGLNQESLQESAFQMSALNGFGENNSAMDMLLRKARDNLTESKSNTLSNTVTALYASIAEATLARQIKNGLLGSNVTVSIDQYVGKLMLSRALAGQYTRLLFVPAEMLSYIATDYNRNGTGRSLMDGIKTAASYRSIMQFARASAQMRNSINRSKVDVTLDPDDPDPEKTREIIKHDVASNRQPAVPLGLYRSENMTDWSRYAGIEMAFSGHPAVPEMTVDISQTQAQHVQPDTEFNDDVRRQTIMGLMLSPEQVDNAMSPELATTVVTNNVLTAKRFLRKQRLLMPQFTDLVRKLFQFDPILRDLLLDVLRQDEKVIRERASKEQRELLEANADSFFELIIDELNERMEITLPKPDSSRLESLLEELNNFIEALDVMIDKGYLPDGMFETSADDESGKLDMDNQRNLVKAYFIRDWAARHNFLPELNVLVSHDETNKPNLDLFEIIGEHSKALTMANILYIRSMDSFKEAANKDLEDAVGEGDGGGSTEDAAATDDDAADSMGMDDDMGMDGFGDDGGEDDAVEGEESVDEEATDDEANPEEDAGPLDQ